MEKYINDLKHAIANNASIQFKLGNLFRNFQVDHISEHIIKNEKELIQIIITAALSSFPTYSNFGREDDLINYNINVYKLVCKLDIDFVVELYTKKNIAELKFNSIGDNKMPLLKFIIDTELAERKYKKDIQDLKNRIDELEEINKQLETHIEYMPDGNGYQEAKEHFESLTLDD
jgi:hypothetical protein